MKRLYRIMNLRSLHGGDILSLCDKHARPFLKRMLIKDEMIVKKIADNSLLGCSGCEDQARRKRLSP